MAKKSAAEDDSSAFRDDYLASSYPSSSSSSSFFSLRDGNKKSTSSVASAANNAPLRGILTRILESRDNEGWNCTILESRGENEDGRGDGLLLPPPAPPSSSSATKTADDHDPLRGILAGYTRVGDDSNGNNGGVGRDHRTPPSSKGKNRDRNEDEGTKEEGAEVTVETYYASPLLRRSHERALERRSFMEEMRKTLPMTPATKSEYAKGGEGRTMREDRERVGSKKAATMSSEQDEPPRPTSMRMKKLWDFGDPEQRPHRAETPKDNNIIGDGVGANDDYCDLNYYTSGNDVDDVVRAEHDKYDDDGATWSLSRIRRESRRLLTRQARDDLLEVERFATEMKGRMESLRRLQRGREVREESGEGPRRERERERERELEMKSERIIATATATAATNASTTPVRKREEDADDDIESLARRQVAVKARSSPAIRGGRQSKITGGQRDISDGTNDPRGGAGLHRFRQSRRGAEEEEEDKREQVLQRPPQQRSRVIDDRDYDGSSKSAISRTTESSSNLSPSDLDLERHRSEHTKKEHNGDCGDISEEKNGSSGGMDERLDSWWKMQQLRRRHEKQRCADTPIFKELVGEPTVAEVDSSASSTITRIGQEQHLLHQRRISDVVGAMPPPSPPSNTASSSPWLKGTISADTVKTPHSGTTPEMAKLSRHEPFRSSLRSGLQQSSPIISVSRNSLQTSSDLSANVKYAARRSSKCAMIPERHENKATYFPTKRNTGKIASDSIRSNNENSSDGQMPPPWLKTTTSKTSSSSPITGSVVNTANMNDIAHITKRRMRTRTLTSSPASLPALANDNVNVNGDNKHEKVIDGTKNGDRVDDGSMLSVLLRRIEETKSGFTRALLDGNVEEQTTMANLMTTLGEAAMTLRKLETTNE